MKNTFVIASLVFAVGYPSALAAEAIGIVSTSILSFPVFTSCFTACGILAIAFHDYSRKPNCDAQPKSKPVAQPNPAGRHAPRGDASWVNHTASA